jgi:cell division protein ZapA (FtsZ GTPase activity inhibitor)
MSPLAQIVAAAVTAGLPTLTVLVGILLNNQRLSDLGQRMGEFEKRMDQRFAEVDKRFTEMDKRTEQRLFDLRDLLRSEFFRVERVMDARLRHLEESSQH